MKDTGHSLFMLIHYYETHPPLSFAITEGKYSTDPRLILPLYQKHGKNYLMLLYKDFMQLNPRVFTILPPPTYTSTKVGLQVISDQKKYINHDAVPKRFWEIIQIIISLLKCSNELYLTKRLAVDLFLSRIQH